MLITKLENESPNSFTERMFEKYYAKKLPKMTYKDFLLKIPGLPQYISGTEPLVNFPYVKESLQNGKKAELMLTEKVNCHVIT